MAIKVGTYVEKKFYDDCVGKIRTNDNRGKYDEIKYEVYFFSPKQIKGLESLDDSEFNILSDDEAKARMERLGLSEGGSRKSRRRSRKNKRTRRVRR